MGRPSAYKAVCETVIEHDYSAFNRPDGLSAGRQMPTATSDLRGWRRYLCLSARAGCVISDVSRHLLNAQSNAQGGAAAVRSAQPLASSGSG